MLFATNFAIKKEGVVAAVMTAHFIFTRFRCKSTHIQSKLISDLARRHRFTKYRPTKIAWLYDLDLARFL